MSLARAWTRQLYGASGAALIVPGTIVAALALLALAGGFGQLGALGQAFAGPSVPVAVKATGGLGNTPARPSIAPAPRSAPAATGTTLVSAGTPAARTGAPGAAGNGTAGHPNGGSAGFGGRGATSGSGHGGGSGSPGPGTTPTPPGTTPPASQPTLVDGVVDLGTSITSKIPGPVGAAATQLLQGVGKTVDGILPLTPHSSATTSSQ
jgi:hypothetical protein